MLTAGGWRPRARGWWSKDADGTWSFVAALTVHTRGLPAGEGEAVVHLGPRHDSIERRVAAACGYRASYRDMTVNVPIGELLPSRGWLTWRFDANSAAEHAGHIAEAVGLHGEAFCARIADDPDELLRHTGERRHQTTTDAARHVVATEHARGVRAAVTAADEIVAAAAGRDDEAAADTRAVLASLAAAW